MKTNTLSELVKSIENAKEDLQIAKSYMLLIELWNNRKDYTFIYKDINNDDNHVVVNLFEGISFFFDFGKQRTNLLDYFNNYVNTLKICMNNRSFVSIGSDETDRIFSTILDASDKREKVKIIRQKYLEIIYFAEDNGSRFKRINEILEKTVKNK